MQTFERGLDAKARFCVRFLTAFLTSKADVGCISFCYEYLLTAFGTVERPDAADVDVYDTCYSYCYGL